ncbi:MAG: hypothetical protein Phyf2KO_02890 [Phycisphaerales bacterium]
MRIRFALVGCAAAIAGSVSAQGADVIAGDITGPTFWGGLNGVSAYSIGTISCNIGDVDLLWDDTTTDGTPANLHPVMSQNMFRMKDGRFEQIGQSWLKHAFFAIQGSGLCAPTCDAAPNGDSLGPGCNDPYSSGLNGSQSGLGPKFEINAATGQYPWPFTGDGQTGNVIYKRIQVDNDDMNPSLNAGALYFGEGHYVTPDDAAAGNDNNNASYRQINVGNFQSGGYDVDFTGSTMRGSPAIQAWQDFDGSVVLNSLDVPNDGRFWVGYKVTDNGDGTWHYEYAIYNLNSDRAGGSFSVPVGSGVNVTNIGFHDVDYHSGEPYDNTDWTGSVVGNEVVWNSPVDFNTDPNTNALRWGTLYNFRFDADAAPQSVDAVLGLFKPGAQMDYNVPGVGPEGADCLADVNGDGDVTPTDFTAWVNAFNNNLPECDQNGDGSCTPTDFTAWVANFNAGC